ncbi:MAG: HAMP domain-containing protein [Clostridiales bacterium]|jgi:two-component system sensor histidine kinase VanS|nr:HAMP domain-containing protein [Clostridiales bacterium]
MKKSGIFSKVFSYTIIAISLLVGVAAALFSQQFFSIYKMMQNRGIVASYDPLVRRIQGGEYQNIAESAKRFYENNQSFEFHIMDKDGGTIFTTPNADTTNSFEGDFYFVVHKDMDIAIIAQSRTGLDSFYKDFLIRAITIFSLMLLLCLICAYVFAKRMTKPIKTLADNASKMAALEEVPPPTERKDELGALAHEFYVWQA